MSICDTVRLHLLNRSYCSRHGWRDFRDLPRDVERICWACNTLGGSRHQMLMINPPNDYRRPNLNAGRSSRCPPTRTHPHLEPVLRIAIQRRLQFDPGLAVTVRLFVEYSSLLEIVFAVMIQAMCFLTVRRVDKADDALRIHGRVQASIGAGESVTCVGGIVL